MSSKKHIFELQKIFMSSPNEKLILEFIRDNVFFSSKEIHDGLNPSFAYPTTKRVLSKLLSDGLIEKTGQGKGTKYRLASNYEVLFPIDIDKYFEKEIDERETKEGFNFSIIDLLQQESLFTKEELTILEELQGTFERNSKELSESEYNNELERLAIDLSWKSSQIEGNTYSLLETERLLKEKETVAGKGKDEALMLLNHKEAIDFVLANPNYVSPLTTSSIEDIHSILVNGLGIERNIRKRRVGISGTNYRPLDNEFQIREALVSMCHLVNSKKNVFEKALLPLVLISYIQPFTDGNKRTARIVSNAILIDNNYCPISFRTVDSVDYKKAMLLFYEQNNISAFKSIFIEQFEFAVKTYF
jgi:predicted transcriptional regulator